MVFWFFIRGKSHYIPSLRLNAPKRSHVLPVVLGFLILASGSTLLDLVFGGEKYINFSLYNVFYANNKIGFFNVLYTVIAFAIIPSILEEVIFRGALCAEFEDNGTFCSVISSAFFFSLLSFDFAGIPTGIFTGIILAIILYATDSLICSIILRICYSLFAIFAKPILVSFKDVSANLDLLVFILILMLLVSAIFFVSRLSRLYQGYSEKNLSSEHTSRVPPSRLPQSVAEILLSRPAICCYSAFIIITVLQNYVL